MGSKLYIDDTTAQVKNAKGLHLMTHNTPNGQKVQILLEELADAYGTQWTTTIINLSANEQKKEWFLRLNPNGRIPVIVDNERAAPFPVMETSAELLYLLTYADKENKFGFTDELEKSECIQWLFFWHGSGAPYQGNLGFFNRSSEKVPLAIERFRKETLRVFGVLEIRLSGLYTLEPRDYLAGNGKGKYSVADIGTWTWVSGWKSYSRITDEEMSTFPHVLKWINLVAERPAVKRGTGDKYKL